MKRSIYKLTSGDIQIQLRNLRQLTFEVTDACNLKCEYCGYGDLYDGYDLRKDKYFPFHKAKHIIDYLYDIWNRESLDKFYHSVAISFYGGEPLINTKFIKDTIDYVEKKISNRELYYSMTTNAMLLDKHMDFLADKKFRLLINVSST